VKILVTGGTGAVVRFVCRELVARGQEPVIASRHTPTESPEAVEWVEWDMARESALDVMRDHQVTRVIHLAAVVGVAGDADVPETLRVNGSTTVDLLASARQTGVERVVICVETMIQVTTRSGRGGRPAPSHTTGHAGPHPAVRQAVGLRRCQVWLNVFRPRRFQ